MKFIATLLIAAVFASAVMADEAAPAKSDMGIKETIMAKAQEIQGKVNEAIMAGKAKIEEIAKQLQQKREEALAKINELRAQLDAKIKDVIPAIGKAREQAAQVLKEQLTKAIERIDAAQGKPTTVANPQIEPPTNQQVEAPTNQQVEAPTNQQVEPPKTE